MGAAGKTAEALVIAERLVEAAGSNYVSPYFIGMSLLGAGDIERAFHYFEAAQAEKSPWMVWWGTEPKLDRIKTDDRYWNILRQTNNPIIDLLERPIAAE